MWSVAASVTFSRAAEVTFRAPDPAFAAEGLNDAEPQRLRSVGPINHEIRVVDTVARVVSPCTGLKCNMEGQPVAAWMLLIGSVCSYLALAQIG